MTEIELKFEIAGGERERVLAARALASAAPRRMRLSSWYFDTPEGALASRDMALRLRREGRHWVQCLKAGASGTGGLHSREEWEFPRASAAIDLSLFAATPLAQLPGAGDLHRTLVAAFRVDMERRTWRIDPGAGCRLEVALDAGVVESGARSEAISELEIECLEGDPACAFALAHELLEEVALRPSSVSKAERGYRLFNGTALRPARAQTVSLDAGAGVDAAARSIVAAGLAQLQANEEGVLRGRAPEFVHQARVALRRTRSALRMFRAAIGEEDARRWRDQLGEATRALGVARDWDVFATETLPALRAAYGDDRLVRALARRTASERARAREEARQALRSRAYARVILELAQWLSGPRAAAIDPPQALPEFASRLIRKRHKRLVAGLAQLSRMPPAERHRVRIDAKRLRYAVEGLAAIFPAKRARAYARRLSDLQDALGEANDAASAERLLAQVAPPEPLAQFTRGWLAARAAGDTMLLQLLARRLERSRRFWGKRTGTA